MIVVLKIFSGKTYRNYQYRTYFFWFLEKPFCGTKMAVLYIGTYGTYVS